MTTRLASKPTASEAHGFDVEGMRSDFPILAQRINGKPLVYLDNGATAQKPAQVIAAIEGFYSNYNANVHRGVHTLSEKATAAYEQARKKSTAFVNAGGTNEIIFVSGTTEAINLIAQSYGRSNVGRGDEIMISEMEHHSNIVPWQLLCEQSGAVLRVIPINDAGELILDEYKRMLNESTRIVSIGHISNALGTVNPVKEIISLAHDCGAVTVIDGAQAAPHIPIDVQDLDCDFYAFSGHKLFGPTGIGVLYGKERLLEAMPPYQGGGDMIRSVSFEKTEYNVLPYKLEAGTPHIAGGIGLGAAIDYMSHLDFAALQQHESDLLQYATAVLSEIDGLRIVGTAAHKASILSFTLHGIHPHDLGTVLDHEGIAIRAGHHCAMPVMKRFGIPATARASFAFYNTRSEIERLHCGIIEAKKVFA